jgi:hypothetical protein
MMRDCLAHADEMRRHGHLIESQMLEGTETAKSLRIRNGRPITTDGGCVEVRPVRDIGAVRRRVGGVVA